MWPQRSRPFPVLPARVHRDVDDDEHKGIDGLDLGNGLLTMDRLTNKPSFSETTPAL